MNVFILIFSLILVITHSYNPKDAIKYAKKYYKDYNPNYGKYVDNIVEKANSYYMSNTSNKLGTNLINELFKSFELRLSQNVFNSKNYNDIIFELSEIMKKYNSSGKGSFKSATSFSNSLFSFSKFFNFSLLILSFSSITLFLLLKSSKST